MSDLWNDNVQYGRIVFFANMQSDTERKISGTVEIGVYLQDNSRNGQNKCRRLFL